MKFIIDFRAGQSISNHQKAVSQVFILYKQLGNKEETLSFFHRLLNFIRYKQLYSTTFYYLSELYQGVRREKYLQNAIKTAVSHKENTRALAKLFQYYNSRRMDNLAISTQLKLIDIQKKSGDQAGIEKSLYELANFFQQKRIDFFSALKYYFEALNHSDPAGKGFKGEILLNIARVFDSINRKELAQKYIKRAMDLGIKYRDIRLRARVLQISSRFALAENKPAESLKYINLGIKTMKDLGRQANLMEFYYDKGVALWKLGELKPAMDLLGRAVTIGLNRQVYTELLPMMALYTENLIAMDRLPEANFYIKKIDDIYASYYSHYYYYYFLSALYWEKKGNLTKALALFNKCLDKLDDYFTSLEDYRYIGNHQGITDIYTRAIEFFLTISDQTKDDQSIYKALYLGEVKNTYDYQLVSLKSETYAHLEKEKKAVEREMSSYHSGYLQALNNSSDVDTINFFEAKLDSLRHQLAEVQELIVETPYKYKKQKIDTLDIPLIQSRLMQKQMVLKYMLLQERAYVFVIEKDSIGYMQLPVTSTELQKKIQILTEPLDDFTKGKVDYLRINYNLELARELYGILLAKILKEYPRKRDIFVIPDRELFRVPFEALVTGFNSNVIDSEVVFSEYTQANYLVQQCQITYYFSLFHLQNRWQSGKRKQLEVVAFGYPTIGKQKEESLLIGSAERQLFREIPSSAQEISDIKNIVRHRRARFFAGPHFNIKNFLTFAPRSRILHIATHFVNNIYYPQHSALLFSSTEREHVLFYAHQMFDLRLESELVVLSACESSENRLMGIQGLKGMTAAFKNAGVQSMVVSMWPVDEQSACVVPLLYRQLAKTRRFAAALRQAKLDLMGETREIRPGLKISMSHPFLWANYILIKFYY